MQRPTDHLAWAWVAEESDATPPLSGVLGARRTFVREGESIAVADGGEAHVLQPVSRYADIPPRQRPPAFCPECLTRVTLKLGRRVRHHYAHPPAARSCVAASGEGALHLEAKLHLAAALAGGGSALPFRLLCAGWPGRDDRRPCPAGPAIPWAVAWDSVAVERSVGARRPDVVLLRGGVEVGGLEVYVSHAVDAEKRAALAAGGLPWIEVSGREIVPDGRPRWRPGEALVARAHWSGAGEWRCGPCAAGHAGYLHHQANGEHRLAWRRAHVYVTDAGRLHGSPSVDHVIVTAVVQRRDGQPTHVWLTRERDGTRLTTRRRIRGHDAALLEAHALFREWIRETRSRPGAAVDSPMQWHVAAERERPSGDDRRFPMRYRWDGWSQAWLRVPGLPAVCWPLPPGGAARCAHAVAGDHPVAWSALRAGDARLTHLVAGIRWLVLRAESGALSLRLWTHDGTSWQERNSLSIQPPRPDWPDRLAAALRELGETDEEPRLLATLGRLLGADAATPPAP